MDKKSKSGSSSKLKDRSRSPHSDDGKSKRASYHSGSAEKGKSKERKNRTKSVQRKSRWQSSETEKKDVAKCVPKAEADIKKEKSLLATETYPSIKELLPNREKLVDALFELVTAESLEKITPDYLKKCSREELKKMCLEQLKKTSDEAILQITCKEDKSSNKDEEEKVEKEQNLCVKPDQTSTSKEKEKEDIRISEKKPEDILTVEVNDSLSSDVVELHTTATEMESFVNEETQIPVVIKEEVAKDLILPERDAELLELEMRARAIRSLLKAKNQVANEEDEAVGEK